MVVVLIVIGWVVVVPAVVVCGLLVASSVLGRRARATGPDVTWMAHELAELWREPVGPLAPIASAEPEALRPPQPIAH